MGRRYTVFQRKFLNVTTQRSVSVGEGVTYEYNLTAKFVNSQILKDHIVERETRHMHVIDVICTSVL